VVDLHPDFAAFAHRVKGSNGESASSTTSAGPVIACACTITFPVISSPVPPSLQRR
jgi:hypothetical protein